MRINITVFCRSRIKNSCGSIESVENREALEAVSHKIQQKLSDGFLIEGQLILVRTSIGIAMFPEDGDSPEDLIKQADIRMYADKNTLAVKLRLV